jgi:hypothetical protein
LALAASLQLSVFSGQLSVSFLAARNRFGPEKILGLLQKSKKLNLLITH